MDGKMLARLGAIIFIAVAITATAIEMTRQDDKPASGPVRPLDSSGIDPLRDELRRCQRLGEPASRDAECLRVWGENRDRFLRPGNAPAARPPAPAPSSSQNEAR